MAGPGKRAELDDSTSPSVQNNFGLSLISKGILSWSLKGSLAQLVARVSHNPKVVSSILTGTIFIFHTFFTLE